MSKAKAIKTNWLDRFSLGLKMKVPHGVILSTGETKALVEVQEKDIKVLKDNQQEVLAAIGVTRSVNLTSQIKKASSAASIAARTYKQTKDPIKKREWARRLIVANSAQKSLNSTMNRMEAARDRLEMIKGDMEIQIIEAEARVAETRAYARAGEQLRLAGETLVNARTRAKNSAIEYTNLEVTMEGAEALVNNTEPDELLRQADEIVGAQAETSPLKGEPKQ